eukprot:CAMPEP_0118925352 /NCGR_PEP_ID=MMETSP1169-20130426/3239_1 /TAXON_ID=36882 /ORGANISM="Pyramimonas obovata, Strain CCMP722" /LENGTH=180 /DNA_ID=CAMNT_0006866609 /DNA_START=85 /DNA_END=623 /DNA_ORIENTATION=-
MTPMRANGLRGSRAMVSGRKASGRFFRSRQVRSSMTVRAATVDLVEFKRFYAELAKTEQELIDLYDSAAPDSEIVAARAKMISIQTEAELRMNRLDTHSERTMALKLLMGEEVDIPEEEPPSVAELEEEPPSVAELEALLPKEPMIIAEVVDEAAVEAEAAAAAEAEAAAAAEAEAAAAA